MPNGNQPRFGGQGPDAFEEEEEEEKEDDEEEEIISIKRARTSVFMDHFNEDIDPWDYGDDDGDE